MLEKVLVDFNVKGEYAQPFEVEDPFNIQNVLKGYILRVSDERYGAMAITHVNNEEAYQIIFGTSKQKYPFGRDGLFHFPVAKTIEVYEKLDGTNICAYNYNVKGKEFQTYKLRLFPVLRNSRFGDFLDMWKELLGRYPEISQICAVNDGCNISFEMYGSRNIHLILYDTPLEVALLFGINKHAEVISPSKLNRLSIPSAKLIATISSSTELVTEYNRLREKIESQNKRNDDDTISGIEGTVWYLTDISGKRTQFKCKPESIEQIHWASSSIDLPTILATAHNVLETSDRITYESVVELLKEEFNEEQIRLSEIRIKNAVKKLQAWYEFQRKVLQRYYNLGVSILENKGAVMREMAKHFPKSEIKKAYTAIIQCGK